MYVMTAGELSGLVALPTALAGLVAALAKWLADVSSQRIARREQADLDERVKKIESQLAKESLEHEVRFRRIDKEVADVLSNVYDRLFVLFECSHRFVRLGAALQIVDQSDTRTAEEREGEARSRLEEANRAFKEGFFRKRLYVPKDLFLSVRAFHGNLIGTVSEFTRSLARARETGRSIASDEWRATMDRLNNEHTHLLDGITEAFQKTMGL
jgi:hypothetical protein